MADTEDLVAEFFNSKEEAPAVDTTIEASKLDQLDNAYDDIKSILTAAGVSDADSDYVYTSLKDSFECNNCEDESCDIAAMDSVKAELIDVLTFVLPNSSDDDIADLTSKIVDAISKPVDIDFGTENEMGPEEASIMKEIEDKENAAAITPDVNPDEDDLDPDFWN